MQKYLGFDPLQYFNTILHGLQKLYIAYHDSKMWTQVPYGSSSSFCVPVVLWRSKGCDCFPKDPELPRLDSKNLKTICTLELRSSKLS